MAEWISNKNSLRQQIAEEMAKNQELRKLSSQRLAEETIVPETSWINTSDWIRQKQNINQNVNQVVETPVETVTSKTINPARYQFLTQSQRIRTTQPQQVVQQTTINKTTPTPVTEYSEELDPLHPLKGNLFNKDTPLWAKALNFIGKPFELVQEYLFDPLLGAIQGKWAEKTLTSSELQKAKKEGIASFFPGGVRHKAYEQLKYTGKWLVEMLPWLIIPGMGTVGAGAKAGTGLAGALGRAAIKSGTGFTSKALNLAGRMIEYSPAGLTEKAVGKAVGVVGSRLGKKVVNQAIPTTQDPLINSMLTAIGTAQKKVTPQRVMTKEFRVKQAASVAEAINKASGKQGTIDIMRAAQGEAEKIGFDGIESLLKPEEVKAVYDRFNDYGRQLAAKGVPLNQLSAGRALKILMEGGEKIPAPSELKALSKVYGNEVVEAWVKKAEDSIAMQVADVINGVKSVVASGDLSAGRQLSLLFARRPQDVPKVMLSGVKSLFSDKSASLVDDAIRSRSRTSIADQLVGKNGTRLNLTPLPSEYKLLPAGAREESFASSWIENVPILGAWVKSSNRAFVNMANDARSLAWESTIKAWEKVGKEIAENDYSELASMINVFSGRGKLPKSLERSGTLLNATLFAPRYFFSRLQIPTKLMSNSPMVRKEAAKTLVSFVAAGSSILALAKVMGGKIELDSKSADFGKIKIGNTRLDIWSGYAQWARFLTQLATGERKTASGNITEVNRAEVVQRFIQSKASPLTSLLYDIWRGESYSGEEVSLDTDDLQRQAYNRMMPLFIQDILDAIEQEGLLGGLTALPGGLGVGVVTYMSPVQKMREKIAKEKYGMTWEEIGKSPQYGRATQIEIDKSDYKLIAAIEKEQEDYNKTITGKSDINNIYRNYTSTIESEYKNNIDRATEEYRDTGDGYAFREKINAIAAERRAQYNIINKDPQFAKVVAKYDTIPDAKDMNNISPQDFARREYNRMMYGDDMYDQYGNYRFDMMDDVKAQFVDTFGKEILDYVEEYQGIKEAEMTEEYKLLKEAQRVLKPYWAVEDEVIKLYGEPKSKWQANNIASLISKIRKRMRLTNSEIEKYYQMFYAQKDEWA